MIFLCNHDKAKVTLMAAGKNGFIRIPLHHRGLSRKKVTVCVLEPNTDCSQERDLGHNPLKSCPKGLSGNTRRQKLG